MPNRVLWQWRLSEMFSMLLLAWLLFKDNSRSRESFSNSVQLSHSLLINNESFSSSLHLVLKKCSSIGQVLCIFHKFVFLNFSSPSCVGAPWIQALVHLGLISNRQLFVVWWHHIKLPTNETVENASSVFPMMPLASEF